jgi:hypothetical protein
VAAGHGRNDSDGHDGETDDLSIDQDVILAAPIWHDWAKSIVFQWNEDGNEFTEFTTLVERD